MPTTDNVHQSGWRRRKLGQFGIILQCVSVYANEISCYSPFLCNYLGWQSPIV